jgi:hypothetical protein
MKEKEMRKSGIKKTTPGGITYVFGRHVVLLSAGSVWNVGGGNSQRTKRVDSVWRLKYQKPLTLFEELMQRA